MAFSSNSSVSDDWMSIKSESLITVSETNPFRNLCGGNSSNSSSDSDLADVINNLNLTLKRNNTTIKDVRHIDTFNGDGNNSLNVIKLNNFLLDLDEFFLGRDLSENDKLIIAKQKISGPAKSLINSVRPINFLHLKDVLQSSFGTVQADYETLIQELKNCKINSNEQFQQYFIRVEERAKVLTYKLECGFENKAVFEPFAKTVLSNFPPHVSTQNEVLNAISCCNSTELYRQLDRILQFNPNILLRKPKNINHKGNTQINSVTCANCYNRGHVVKDCNAVKRYNRFFRASE